MRLHQQGPLTRFSGRGNPHRGLGRTETGIFLELVRSTPRAHKVASEAARDQTRAEANPWSLRMEGFGGPWQPWKTPSNPRAGAIADTANLAPVSSEYRMKVLHCANPAVAAHILVSLAIKVVGDACDNLLCQAGPRRGLEEGQPI